VSLYNEKIDRTFRIDGSLSIAAKIAVFVQSISISLDAVVSPNVLAKSEFFALA